jgi:hypothetical protein
MCLISVLSSCFNVTACVIVAGIVVIVICVGVVVVIGGCVYGYFIGPSERSGIFLKLIKRNKH